MRRYAFPILFLIVLGAPFVLRWALGKSASSPGSGGDKLKLVIITPHVESLRREFAEAFSHWHEQKFGQAVRVEYLNYGGASAMVKYFEASKPTFESLGHYNVDLAWGGGDYLFDAQLKGPGYLEPVALDPKLLAEAYPSKTLAGLPLYDTGTPPQWFGTALSSFGIGFNRDVFRYLQLSDPTTWRDLTNPRLHGWIVLADPTLSASAKTAFMIVVERAMADAAAQGRSEDDGWADGMGTLRLIAANTRLFTDAGSTIPAIIASGDVAAGMTIDFFSRSTIEAVGEQRMGYVEPLNATAMNPDPVAMVKGAPNRETAAHFIEFLLSEQGQRLLNTRAGAPGGPRLDNLRRLPIRASVYQNPRDFTEKVNPFAAAAEFNTSNARKKTFSIVGELIQMSCMDLLDELRETRALILKSPRAADLDAKLGRFPFGQMEALRRLAEWKAASPVQKLALQRRWTTEFRDEYRRLREEATR